MRYVVGLCDAHTHAHRNENEPTKFMCGASVRGAVRPSISESQSVSQGVSHVHACSDHTHSHLASPGNRENHIKLKGSRINVEIRIRSIETRDTGRLGGSAMYRTHTRRSRRNIGGALRYVLKTPYTHSRTVAAAWSMVTRDASVRDE